MCCASFSHVVFSPAGHPRSPSCLRCSGQRSGHTATVRGDRVRTGTSVGSRYQVLSHEPDCAVQALPVTGAVAVAGPAQEAILYITPGSHWPVPLSPWINKEINMVSGRPGARRFPRAAVADTRPGHLDLRAPLGSSWWGQISAWERRSAVETLVNWSSVSQSKLCQIVHDKVNFKVDIAALNGSVFFQFLSYTEPKISQSCKRSYLNECCNLV